MNRTGPRRRTPLAVGLATVLLASGCSAFGGGEEIATGPQSSTVEYGADRLTVTARSLVRKDEHAVLTMDVRMEGPDGGYVSTVFHDPHRAESGRSSFSAVRLVDLAARKA